MDVDTYPRLEWTAEQAMEADTRYRAAHPGTSHDPATPFFQWSALHRIEAERAAVAAGDGFALLGAIRICANFDLVMPGWLCRAYIQRYDRVLNCRVGSWDEAFGRPYPKGAHLAALRKRRQKALAVWSAVRNAVRANPETPINKELFEEIGERLHIGMTLAEEFYYHAVKIVGFGAKDRAGYMLAPPAKSGKIAGLKKRGR